MWSSFRGECRYRRCAPRPLLISAETTMTLIQHLLGRGSGVRIPRRILCDNRGWYGPAGVDWSESPAIEGPA
jgi:hypothetical protein